ncbi:MAG: ABC transporter ATP-binding protein [Pseudomonadota bacterium]|nr:ABC transporter ATP-binding protein [Pseudomonadota bacterium]
MICTRALTFSYGAKNVLNDINFEVQMGETIEICGDNASGKTTFLKTLAGLLLPTEGQVIIDNLDTKNDFLKIKDRLAYVGVNDGGFFLRLTGQENLSLLAEFYGLNDLSLEKKLHQLSQHFNFTKILKTPFNQMSSGMKQLLRVTLALISDRKVLLLDEPLRSLDKKTRLGLVKILSENSKNRLLIFTNHLDQEWQSLQSKTYRLANGRLQ